MFSAPVNQQPTEQELAAALAKPGQQGRITATKIDPGEHERAHVERAEQEQDPHLRHTAEVDQDVENDFRGMHRYLVKRL